MSLQPSISATSTSERLSTMSSTTQTGGDTPERAPSRTAEAVALARALHNTIDCEPHIHIDSIAPQFFTSSTLADAAESDTDGTRLLRSHVVLRSRFAEDRAAAAVRERGVKNIVMLGAGFDTFSLRRSGLPEDRDDVSVWEVDHPSSQRVKLQRLSDLGLPPPSKLYAIDFSLQSLRTSGLAEQLPQGEPIVFISLGVLMYLKKKDISSMFNFVASFPKGSELIISWAPDNMNFENATFHADSSSTTTTTNIGDDTKNALVSVETAAKAMGEPWLSKHNEEELTKQLLTSGFSHIELLSIEKAAAYFGPLPRADKLTPPVTVSVLAAVV